MVTCECCRKSNTATLRKTEGQKVKSAICADCAKGGHYGDFCLLCGERVWFCARLAHVSTRHSSVLQKMDNDPAVPKQRGTKPPLRVIGQVRLDD